MSRLPSLQSWPRWTVQLCQFCRRLRPTGELQAHCDQCTAILVCFFVIAGVTYHSPPVLLPLFMKEFNVSEYDVSWVPAFFQLAKGVLSLPGGFAVAHLGAAKCIRLGALLLLTSGAILPFCSSLPPICFIYGLYGASYCLAGLPVTLAFQTSWFLEQRSMAISIVLTAFSLSGAAFPPLLSVLADRFGWRAVAAACPVSMFIIVLPIACWVLRDGPHLARRDYQQQGRQSPDAIAVRRLVSLMQISDHRDSGLQRPSNHASQDKHHQHVEELENQEIAEREAVEANGGGTIDTSLPRSFLDSLRYEAVWHLAMISFCQMYVVIAFINSLILYLERDVKMPLKVCALYNSVVFVCSVVGKLVVGALLHSSRPTLVSIVGCALLVLGTIMPLHIEHGTITPTTSFFRLLAFAIVYGLGYGASFTVLSAKQSVMFGAMPEFGKLLGFLFACQMLGGFLGTLITGKLRTLTGSYGWPFCVFVVMATLAFLHFVALEARCVDRSRCSSSLTAATPCSIASSSSATPSFDAPGRARQTVGRSQTQEDLIAFPASSRS